MLQLLGSIENEDLENEDPENKDPKNEDPKTEDLRKWRPTKTKTPTKMKTYENEDLLRKRRPFYFFIGNEIISIYNSSRRELTAVHLEIDQARSPSLDEAYL